MDSIATLRLRKPQNDNIMGLHLESYDLIHCEYSFYKQTDRNGQAISSVMGGNIEVALPILPTDDLMAWVFGYHKYYNGEVTINDAKKELIDKIYFEEARCVNFRLHYEPGNNLNVIVYMTINSQQITLGEAIYQNSWK